MAAVETPLRKNKTKRAETKTAVAAAPRNAGTTESADNSASFLTQLLGDSLSGAELQEREKRVLQRSFDQRAKLLEDTLLTDDLVKLLRISRQAVNLRAKSLFAVLDGGKYRFPSWQFDAEQHDSIVPGIAEVRLALDSMAPLKQFRWMTRANPYLEGRTPIEALRRGEQARVLDAALALGVH